MVTLERRNDETGEAFIARALELARRTKTNVCISVSDHTLLVSTRSTVDTIADDVRRMTRVEKGQ